MTAHIKQLVKKLHSEQRGTAGAASKRVKDFGTVGLYDDFVTAEAAFVDTY